FYNEFRCVNIQFTPGNFFVGNSAAVRTVRSSAVADLAEITPERNIMPLQVLVHHGYHANRKVPGNTAAYLEEAYAFPRRIITVPFSKPDHIFDPAFYGRGLQFAFYDIARKNIPRGAVFPARANNRQVFFCGSYDPAVLRVNFIILFQLSA